MNLEIKWTKRAEKSFDVIFEYIKSNFGDSTGNKFISQSFEILDLLSLIEGILRSGLNFINRKGTRS